ncbi:MULTISPECIES: SIS domain-containing protein [unclassified Breznakia]|uniref:SIS domain-containing protein n=1 Tax=unclassified Breznakia TaxID=2623764 RepID=UPI00247313EF|nr:MULTISPECIES: SIS domain-containing protein [unclassified Breznakia]MDH6367489.1 putative phosphosugar-binding protein [Breznakia sp. PH1-1]MDH6404609.1 putative phosphosugar-binding protein [Breznakia sp. PF1-11]MDH6412318.1 putative phosphosugar-binding protein [Breznakia sp. PFB1-11]MDH6414656.1 putative phosphosugar-binding protein [Breznakia sp. PFB1-14]MDH6416949.1 putative phosphosugar-binding protein [Breznakia sp. PFB1-4]
MKFAYFDNINKLLQLVEEKEHDGMEASVNLLYECIQRKNSIYTFGASHAGIISEELFYRAGGLMLFNPIFGREMMLDTSPITLTSQMERTVGYGTALANSKVNFKKGDVLIIHSVSGRNPVALDVAEVAKEADVHIIVITNVAYSKSTTSRHPNGKRLFEYGDIVLDNHGDIGDACVSIEGLEQKVSPTSTIIASSMMHAIVASLTQKLVDTGMKKPPIFYSANLDGGDQSNQELYELYKDAIHYKF